MKEKGMPLEERIEKIFESGWVNEFNYLETLMQETRSCLYNLQQELQRKDNNWNELKVYIQIIINATCNMNNDNYNEGKYKASCDILDKIKELEDV